MAPPKFDDLGKSAKDIFNKGYNFGFLKVSHKSKTADNFEFNTGATHNIASSALFGNVELKYVNKEYGTTLTEKWNTDNIICTEITNEDQIVRGLKVTAEALAAPAAGKRTGRLKVDFAKDNLSSGAIFDADTKNAVASAVVAYENWLLGAQGTFDSTANKLSRHTLALGRDMKNFGVHANVSDFTDVAGSIYHEVNSQLQVAAQLGYNHTDKASRFALGALYKLDGDTEIRGKLASTQQLGVAMQHSLKPGLKLIMSALISLKDFNAGGHKIGMGLEYESK